jgi:glycosyltransferase involved in cell wall biosynthesis
MPVVDLAIVANAHTPYRAHFHQRIVNEIPGVRLWSLYTHEYSNAPWPFDVPPELRPVLFGKGESAEQQAAPRRALHEWRKGGRVIRFLREHDVGAVVMLGYNDPGRLRVIRWCHRNRIPCFVWGDSNIRGDTAAGLKLRVKRRVLRWVFRRCAGVLPCGRRGVEFFEKYGVDRRQMFLCPVEPDYALPQALTPEHVERVRIATGLSHAGRRIVFSGRLVAAKRADLLIAAFSAIAGRRPDWTLVMVGDGPLRPELGAQVPEPLRDRVFWTGFLGDQADVTAVYRLSDVLVLPSDFEPWALVINEAVAAGLAVVASEAVGAAPELVQEGVNGYLFPAGDLAALTDRLLSVTDEANLHRMKAASPRVLADWRAKADPVNGLRAALRSAGLDV